MKVCIDVDWARQKLCLSEPRSITGRIKFVLGNNTFEGENMALTLSDIQSVVASISYVDAKQNPAVVDGGPVWTASDPAAVEILDVAADGLSATVRAVGPLGNFQVTVVGDADLGEGVRQIITIFDVTVVASEAVAGTVSFGIPA